MSNSINFDFADATQFKHKVQSKMSIHGRERTGKTHMALTLTPGERLGVIAHDPNCIEVVLKTAETWKREGYPRTIIIPRDPSTGRPLEINLHDSNQHTVSKIMSSQDFAKKHYQELIKQRLVPLVNALISKVDGIIIDNGTDLGLIYDYAFYGGIDQTVSMRDRNPRNKALMNLFAMIENSGCHMTVIHKEKEDVRAYTEDGKTKFKSIGAIPSMYDGIQYVFNNMLQLHKIEPFLLNELQKEIKEGITGRNVAPNFIKPGKILARLINSTSDASLNCRNTVWIYDPGNPKETDPETNTLALTLDTYWSRLYPDIEPSYWYSRVR